MTFFIPQMRRAREYHLYDAGGRRYLDFYQDGGRAILGHRPEGLTRALKNAMEKGLYAPLPSSGCEKKLKMALERLFPNLKAFRLFGNEERALSALAEVFPNLRDSPFLGDILDTERGVQPLLWRPFLPCRNLPPVFVPRLPFPGGFAPVLVCFSEGYESSLPDSDPVSPVLVAGLTRVIFDLSRVLDDAKECKQREESWRVFDGGPWVRRGPYLIFSQKEEEYAGLYALMLERGILLPPEYPAVGIIPGEYTLGEIRPMMEVKKGVSDGSA
jgi:hypothetical protein